MLRFGQIVPAESSSERVRLVHCAECILVEDASGCRFAVYEKQKRMLSLRRARFTLETGQSVNLIDSNTFQIAATGETLVRVMENQPRERPGHGAAARRLFNKGLASLGRGL